MQKPPAKNVDPGAEDVSQDKLLKTAFELFFRDLLELVVPDLVPIWDLDSIKLRSEELFADLRKHGHRVPDLIGEVMASDATQLFLIHIEIEGTFRTAFDPRMWEYYFHLRLQTKKKIVPIAIFLRGGPAGIVWREVADQVGTIEIARFRYLAFGLSRSEAAEYLVRPQPLAAALAARMQAGKWDKVEHKIRCLKAISEAEDLDIDRQYILGKIVDTSIRLDEQEEQRFQAELSKEPNNEVQEMAITWQEALAESKATGWLEGKLEGELRGSLHAAHQAVLIAARGRFGSVPASFEGEVRAIDDLNRLFRILEQVAKAHGLDEIDLSP